LQKKIKNSISVNCLNNEIELKVKLINGETISDEIVNKLLTGTNETVIFFSASINDSKNNSLENYDFKPILINEIKRL